MENNELLTKLSALMEGQEDVHPQISPEVESSLYSMAYQLYRNGKYVEAKSFFRFLTIFNGLDRRFWMGLAACYHMLKNYEAAIEAYSAAVLHDPSEPYAHWHAAECFYALGNKDKALEILETTISIASQDEIHKTFVSQLQLIQQAWIETIKGDKND